MALGISSSNPIKSTTTTSTYSGTLTVADGSSFLVVSLAGYKSTASDVPSSALSVTYNGVPMSFQCQGSNTSTTEWTAIFVLQNPSSGANTLSVSGMGCRCLSAVAYEVTGYDTTTPVAGSGGSITNNTATSISFSRTTTKDNNALISGMGARSSSSTPSPSAVGAEITTTGGATLDFADGTGTNGNNDHTFATAHEIVATAGANGHGYSWTSSVRPVLAWVEINVANSGSVGSSSGAGTVSATGASDKRGAGSAAGSSAVSGAGAAIASGAGSSAGVGSTAFAGRSDALSEGAGAGTAVIAGAGASVQRSTGSLDGVAGTAAVGVASASGVASLSGSGALDGVAAPQGHTGAAAGSSSVSFSGAATADGQASLPGSSAASGAGGADARLSGNCAGASVASMTGAATSDSAGTIPGNSTLAAQGRLIVAANSNIHVGAAFDGRGETDARGSSTISVAAELLGAGDAIAEGVATLIGVGLLSAEGVLTVGLSVRRYGTNSNRVSVVFPSRTVVVVTKNRTLRIHGG